MDAGAVDDVVLPAEHLRDLVVGEGHEGEGAERLGDEHVHHLAVLAEVVPEVVLAQVLCAPADEDLPVHQLLRALLGNKRRNVLFNDALNTF